MCRNGRTDSIWAIVPIAHGKKVIVLYGESAASQVDFSKPSVARIYDYALGGKDNLEVDRQTAEAVLAESPDAFQIAIENRAFLTRVVHALAADHGIRQFIDLGSGLPTQNNVHQVAQRIAPASRVVYVDNDPVVLAHGRALLVDNEQTTVITADMRDPDGILGHPQVRSLIDFDEPTAILFISVLHCLPDEADPAALVRRLTDALPADSFLALSHIVSTDPIAARTFTESMRATTDWGRVRTPDEVRGYVDHLEVAEPGLVDANVWRNANPAGGTKKIWEIGGIARKPSAASR